MEEKETACQGWDDDYRVAFTLADQRPLPPQVKVEEMKKAPTVAG